MPRGTVRVLSCPPGSASRREEQRAKKRARIARQVTPPETKVLVSRQPSRLSILETRSIGPSTRRDYEKRRAEFTRFCLFENLRLFSVELLDLAIVDYMDKLYLDGKQAEAGEKILAALKCLHPLMARRPLDDLPRALRALKGFRKMAPNFSRFGLPWEWVAAIANTLIWLKKTESAIAVVLMFDTFLRPNECLSLSVRDVIPPDATRKGYERAVLIIAPHESGRLTKVGEQDGTVQVMDYDAVVTAPLTALIKCTYLYTQEGRDRS